MERFIDHCCEKCTHIRETPPARILSAAASKGRSATKMKPAKPKGKQSLIESL